MTSETTAAPASAPVRALQAELDAGRDLGEVVAHWLCQVAACAGGVDEVTRNRPGSWEAALIRSLVAGTVGENGEHLDELMQGYAAATAAERIDRPCPACGARGWRRYTGRAGEATRVDCSMCAGTGSLVELLTIATALRAYDGTMVARLVDAIVALDDRRNVPAGMVRLEIDVPAEVADALAGIDAEAHLDADAERAGAYALRKFARTLKGPDHDAP